MIRHAARFPLLALAALFLLACGREEAEAPLAKIDPERRSPLLVHIPSETPYVVANLEAVPDELVDKFWAVTADARALAQERLARAIVRLEAETDPDQQTRLLLALLRELDGRLGPDGVEELGIDARFLALYGDPLLPTLRLSLADAAALQGAVERIAEGAGIPLTPRMHGDDAYYRIATGEPGMPSVLVALRPDHLAVSLELPTDRPGDGGTNGARLDRLLGRTLPETAATARLAELNATYGLTSYGTAHADLLALFDHAMELLATLDPAQMPQELVTEPCRSELRELLAMMPESVAGYDRLDASHIDQRFVLALRPDLAEGLQSVAYPMRGMTRSESALMSFAFAMDLLRLRSFVVSQVEAMQAKALQCALFEGMDAKLDQAALALSRPIPPFAGNFHGLRIELDDLEMGPGGPERVSGLLAVAFDNPQMLLGMGQAFVPQLAELKIQPDGEPVAAPPELMPVQLGTAHVAMIPDGFGFSLGPGKEARLRAFLNAPRPEADGTLLAFAYDMGRFNAFQRQMIERMEDQLGDEVEPRFEALTRDLEDALQAYYEALGMAGGEVRATGRGIEILTFTELR